MDVTLSPPANGPVVPDKDHSGMWRSVKVDGILSEAANLCWSKNNVIAQAIREVAWDAANDPQKCPVKRGSREQKSSPIGSGVADRRRQGRMRGCLINTSQGH